MSPSCLGPNFGGLVHLGQVSVALGPHTGTYRGQAATVSKHSVVVVFMLDMSLRISYGGAVMP